MILTTEQISHLREEKRRIESQLSNYGRYFETRDIEFLDGNVGQTIGDSLTEEQYRRNMAEYQKIINILTNSEYQRERTTDIIGIGTKFVIKFDYYDKTKTILLTDYIPGLSSYIGCVSKCSPLGKNVIGKKENEEIQYPVGLKTEPGDHRIIKGTIIEIKTQPQEYIHYIREKNKNKRMSKSATRQLCELKSSASPEKQEEYKKRQAITCSQRELLLLEIERLIRHGTTALDKTRLTLARKKLEGLELALPPQEGIIDIGSRFQIVISSDGLNTEEREYEMINYAVSDELESEYIERISPLGTKLYGLKKDDTFSFRENGTKYQGIVTNISVPLQTTDNLYFPFQKSKNLKGGNV